MCPSYQVTREEEHSTRGRARLLFEMLTGTATRRHRRLAVRRRCSDALDLCLACKGCQTDCPVDVDMATYKAEFLAHHYRRPAAAALALLDGLAAGGGALIGRLRLRRGWSTRSPTRRCCGRSRKRLAGIDRRRELPPFAAETLQHWFGRRRAARNGGTRGDGAAVAGHVHQPRSTRTSAGRRSRCWRPPAGGCAMPPEPVCCGLTWISTGQLDVAKRVLRRTVRTLRRPRRAGRPGGRPGTQLHRGVPRRDAAELFPDDQDVRPADGRRRVRSPSCCTEHTPGWQPPRLDRVRRSSRRTATSTPSSATTPTRRCCARRACEPTRLDSGCCGLAGNFGFEPGHYDVSIACAERVLLPAVRGVRRGHRGPRGRVQLPHADHTSSTAAVARRVHLAEVLAAALHDDPAPAGQPPERAYGRRPTPPPAAASLAALAAGAAAVTASARWHRASRSARRRER